MSLETETTSQDSSPTSLLRTPRCAGSFFVRGPRRILAPHADLPEAPEDPSLALGRGPPRRPGPPAPRGHGRLPVPGLCRRGACPPLGGPDAAHRKLGPRPVSVSLPAVHRRRGGGPARRAGLPRRAWTAAHGRPLGVPGRRLRSPGAGGSAHPGPCAHPARQPRHGGRDRPAGGTAGGRGGGRAPGSLPGRDRAGAGHPGSGGRRRSLGGVLRHRGPLVRRGGRVRRPSLPRSASRGSDDGLRLGVEVPRGSGGRPRRGDSAAGRGGMAGAPALPGDRGGGRARGRGRGHAGARLPSAGGLPGRRPPVGRLRGHAHGLLLGPGGAQGRMGPAARPAGDGSGLPALGRPGLARRLARPAHPRHRPGLDPVRRAHRSPGVSVPVPAVSQHPPARPPGMHPRRASGCPPAGEGAAADLGGRRRRPPRRSPAPAGLAGLRPRAGRAGGLAGPGRGLGAGARPGRGCRPGLRGIGDRPRRARPARRRGRGPGAG